MCFDYPAIHCVLLSPRGRIGNAHTMRACSVAVVPQWGGAHRPILSPIHRQLSTNRSSSNTKKTAAAHNQQPGSSTQSEAAARLVWAVQPTARPRVHIIIAAGEQQQLKASEVVPLQLDNLHPDVLTNPIFGEFLAKTLMSKDARRSGTIAMALSAAYLPSQIDTMRDLADKQYMQTSAYISSDSSTLHVMVRKSTDDASQQHSPKALQAALAAAVGPLAPLSDNRLQVARMAERSLQHQLRLWDAATWSSVLQQKLESNNRSSSMLAVRSLMGPPALQAAQRLVTKKGLHWLELQEDQLCLSAAAAGQPDTDTVNSKSSSSSASDKTSSAAPASSRRRRPKRGSSSAVSAAAQAASGEDDDADEEEEVDDEGEEAEGHGGGCRVIIISQGEISLEEAVDTPAGFWAEFFTDYDESSASVADTAGGVEGSSSSDQQGPPPSGPRITWPNIFGQ